MKSAAESAIGCWAEAYTRRFPPRSLNTVRSSRMSAGIHSARWSNAL